MHFDFEVCNARKSVHLLRGAVCSATLLLLLPLTVVAQSLTSSSAQAVADSLELPPAGNSVPFNPFQSSQYQSYLGEGLRLQEAGQHKAALESLHKAWQISRIEHGLYHESQIPVLESLVASELEAGNWQALADHYDYMEHLYRRLYDQQDPRLEQGLQKISSFHVNAFNRNLHGQREYHLRKAAQVLQLRLEVARLTLAEDHPKVNYLNQSVALSRHQLYLLSDTYREMVARRQESKRSRLFATLD